MTALALTFPFALSPLSIQPFTLKLSKPVLSFVEPETAGLRTGLSKGRNWAEASFMLRLAQHERWQ
jgi:hypothetical protein